MNNSLKHLTSLFLISAVSCLIFAPVAVGYDSSPRKADYSNPAENVALERYHCLKTLQRQIGCFPLWWSLDTGSFALFPVRRSDRVYLLIYGAEWVNLKGASNQLRCYQYLQGKVKLVYSVNLKTRVAEKRANISSFIDYLHSYPFSAQQDAHGRDIDCGYTLAGRANRTVLQDLEVRRDYVQYKYIPYINSLNVYLLSDLENGKLPEKKALGPGYTYGLDKDPVAQVSLKEDKFYEKFGLPAAKGEFEAQ